MDPIDRRAAPSPPVDVRIEPGQREATREGARDPSDFRAWLERTAEAAPSPSAEAVMVATASDTVVQAVAGRADSVDVLYPWTLQAHAHLSQLGGQMHGDPAQVSADDASAMNPTSSARTAVAALPAQFATPPYGALNDFQLPIVVGAASTVRGSNASVSVSDAKPSDAAGTALAASWSERLLRKTVDANGNTTWWLRDYGMGSTEQEALTHSLSSLPLQQRPQRIVINGVEVWRAPHPLPEP
ncbi:hypothetical protein [Pseudoxanthomonas sp. PXM02]|uniref:hypothetical protein n=1 Tax=Pseudoxanthomonas sp. PXM02 TaxID=2769294 RepID=UPI00177BB588|nr:hypothetical protein [Pseudoxanthomonas sp. PXM02]MBD9477417.1 hypothetical protein [Pseudoxanthomonas sp. PXM02]